MMRYFANKIAAYQDFQKILDLRMGYSFEECLSYLSGLGEDGRSLYKNCFFYIDLVYMLIYNTFYFSALLFLLGRTGLKKCNPVLLLPLLGLIFDLGENLLIRQMINNFLTMSQILCNVSSIFTVLKFVCAYGSLGFCGLMVIVLVKQRALQP